MAARLQKEAGRLVLAHEVSPKPSTLNRERLKIMDTHGSASVRVETPHETERIQITVSDALRRRAQSIINDRSINPQWRAIIRYALEISDPCLPDLVRRADAGETVIDIDTIDFSQTPEGNQEEANEEKVHALAEMICRADDEVAAALFVLMGTIETSMHPKVLANAGKHVAFTCCAESNLYGIVDAQIRVVEGELLVGSVVS